MTFIDNSVYEKLRDRIREDDASVQTAAAQLRRKADRVCTGHASAVTDKEPSPHSPTRDPHDYVSIATYWWPNPETDDGLPYVQRDGEVSPDSELYDRPRWARTSDDIVTLAKTAYFLDDPRCAPEAAARLRRWFLDPGTRMNPHLCHAQFVPGRSTGRQYGIIDFSLYLPVVLDHVQLLAALPESPWTADDQDALGRWCADFIDWLEHHQFGKSEEATDNNQADRAHRLANGLAGPGKSGRPFQPGVRSRTLGPSPARDS